MKTRDFAFCLLASGILLGTTGLSAAGAAGQSPSAASPQFTLFGLPTYVEVFGGVSTYPNLMWGTTKYDMDNGYCFGAALGVSLDERFDVELETSYSETSFSGYSDEFTDLSLMPNLIFNQPLFGDLVGYAGAGAGPALIGYDSATSKFKQDLVFSYQLIAGLRYPIAEHVDVFAEYRYVDGQDAKMYGTGNIEYTHQSFQLGLRYSF